MNERPRVLIVEDHAPTRDMMARLLEAAGFEVRTAAGAREGIREARTAPPDLILLDVGLPDQRGDVAAATLRKDALLGGIPVVLVSAQEGLEGRLAECGAAAALRKPFRPQELVRCARRWTQPVALEGKP